MPNRKPANRRSDPVKGRHIVVGVTGGIAAYKAADLVSKLRQSGASVTVVMTDAAKQFVSPLTFESLSDNPVVTDLFGGRSPYVMGHISIAERADIVVIAPATANIIGKIASGIADDALTTTVISCDAPVLVAPAMNDGMYNNPIVQSNIKRLEGLGYKMIGPAEGWLACGRVGKGRMVDVADILEAINNTLRAKRK